MWSIQIERKREKEKEDKSMSKLDLQKFIEENSDWEQKLQEKPYCITITRDEVNGRKLIMFKYSQIDSDFHLNIVRECRGLILDGETLEPITIPFFKFGNYGESYCPEINWKKCWVAQKLDGSLLKLSKHDGEVLWSTNGTIDAFKAPLAEQLGCTAKSFGELAVQGLSYTGLSRDQLEDMLEEDKTYMFELTSPFNKVVVTWHDTKLNFLGVRDNKSFQETYFTEHEFAKIFTVPKVFPLSSIDECVKAAQELGVDEEGFVVCDDTFNRVKVKSPTYVSLHHMRNNGVLSYARGIEIVRGNELGEVLTYFPEFKPHLEEIKTRYDKKVAEVNAAKIELDKFIAANRWDKQPWWIENGGQKRKDIAIWITKNFPIPGLAFGLIDHKIESVEKYFAEIPAEKLVIGLGFKD